MKPPVVVLGSLFLASVIALACGDGNDAPASGGGGFAPIPSTGTGSTPSALDGSSDADATTEAEPVGAALCEGVEQHSQEVAEIALPGPAPAPTGGEIALGRYVLNELLAYGAPEAGGSDPPPPPPTGAVSRSTLIVSAKNLRFIGADGASDAALPADEARASTYVVDGTNLNLVSQCGAGAAATTIAFSAGDGSLTLYRSAEKLATYRLDRF